MTTSHSTQELMLVGSAALALGLVAGAAISNRDAQSKLRKLKHKMLNVLVSLGANKVIKSLDDAVSTNGSATAGYRTRDLPEDVDPETLSNVRLAVVIRADELQDAGELVCHASKTVLGHFKKLYKRKDVNLKLWEGGGQRMEVRIASSESVLVAVQEAARAAGMATHTFAGKHGQAKKERSVMVVGPADKAKLWDVVGKLEQA